MKKTGIINGQLIKMISLLGHCDLFMISDSGMPIPNGVEIIDLAVCGGVPSFEQIFNAVISETEVEYYFLASEIDEHNDRLKEHIFKTLPQIENEMIPHDELKQLSKKCKFAIRTGEFSPYANVILRAGVCF